MWISAGALLLGILMFVTACRKRFKQRAGRANATPAVRRPWRMRVAALLWLAVSALFFYAWVANYLIWDFNELGRHYDPVDQVVYTDAGAVWVLPAALALMGGLWCAWRGWRR
ncbi:hypothetical protein RAS12_05060 [Achromobacter seleniivolatilans]|uniref:Uncharacterized protein n=1 Tax=Achromobacter seleniivolatilans TaxID=3047478 RepID=A0ABY9M4W6_9BURK|nr:hypothetical protein [Achromobacter sp. R39]WMD21750.1 hypothetical protein RAS12_05060 [Achromobacter sp. R39]